MPATATAGQEWQSIDTGIPLSVAFFDQDLHIRNIADMEPYSLETHQSAGPVRYALDVNQGGFERNVV